MTLSRRFIATLMGYRDSPVFKRLIVSAFWSAIGESFSKGLLLLSMVMVARILGNEGFGEFGILRTTVNMFSTLGGMGLGFTANRFIAKHSQADKGFSGQIIGSSYMLAAGFGALLAGIVFAASGYLAEVMFSRAELADELRIAALLLLLASINGAQLGVLQGLNAYRRLAVASVLQGTVGLCAFLGGAWYFGLNGAMSGFLVYSSAGVMLFHLAIHAEVRRQQIAVSYVSPGPVMPIFWSFSVPAALMGIAVAPFKWLCETMLVRTAGFVQLGIFHAAMTIATIFLALVSTLNSPLISLTAGLQGSAGRPAMQRLNLYASWYVFLVLVIPFLLFPALPGLVFGEGYSGATFSVVSLLLLTYCGLLVYYQGIMRLVALHGSMWFGLVTNLCEGLALLVAFYLLQSQGVIGLAVAYVCSYGVRILVTTPFLLARQIVPANLVFDRYFMLSLLVFFAALLVQTARFQ